MKDTNVVFLEDLPVGTVVRCGSGHYLKLDNNRTIWTDSHSQVEEDITIHHYFHKDDIKTGYWVIEDPLPVKEIEWE